MNDLIDRQAVENITWEEPSYTDPLNVLTEVRDKVRALPSVESKGEWIPITYRHMTEEEKEHYSEHIGCDKENLDAMFNCRLPDDGEEVLITVFGEVETDIFYRDVDWCSFENRDISDVTAWQPLPEPYKAKRGET